MDPHRDASAEPIHYQRFDTANRLLHGALMFSFLGLAFTGMPLLFSDAPWALTLAAVFGGGQSAGVIHRIFASVMIGCFTVHVFRLMHRLYVKKELEVLWGPSSMTPQPRDLAEMLAHIKWFMRLGPPAALRSLHLLGEVRLLGRLLGHGRHRRVRSRALVPGVLLASSCPVRGSTSRCWSTARKGSWRSASSSRFTSSTATCAPTSSPWTPVIFTGRVTRHEFMEERPAEFERLEAGRTLEEIEVAPAQPWVGSLAKGVAIVAVTLGLVMVGLILYAVLFSRH